MGNSLLLSFLNALSIARMEDEKPLCTKRYLQVANNLYFCILKKKKFTAASFWGKTPIGQLCMVLATSVDVPQSICVALEAASVRS